MSASREGFASHVSSNQEKCWLSSWMERGELTLGHPLPILLGSQQHKICPCLLAKAKRLLPNLWAKSGIILFFGHTSISLVVPFYTSHSSRNLIVSYLASTGSCLFLARATLDFISSSFPPSSRLTTAPRTAILCICNKSVNFRNYLYFMGIHTLCQNDGPKVWRVISTPEFVSWWWMAVKPLWLLRLHCGWNNGGGHKSGSGEQRIKLLGRMAGSCRHDHLLTLKGFKNKWAETETILFGEAISCNVWQWSGHSWCVSSLMSPECPIKLGCYRPSATGTMLCMNDSPSTYWLPAWRKQLATLRFKQGWQYS